MLAHMETEWINIQNVEFHCFITYLTEVTKRQLQIARWETRSVYKMVVRKPHESRPYRDDR